MYICGALAFLQLLLHLHLLGNVLEAICGLKQVNLLRSHEVQLLHGLEVELEGGPRR